MISLTNHDSSEVVTQIYIYILTVYSLEGIRPRSNSKFISNCVLLCTLVSTFTPTSMSKKNWSHSPCPCGALCCKRCFVKGCAMQWDWDMSTSKSWISMGRSLVSHQQVTNKSPTAKFGHFPTRYPNKFLPFQRCRSKVDINNVLLIKIKGPVWYTIYHHLPVKGGFFKPLY